jgi:alanine racemase
MEEQMNTISFRNTWAEVSLDAISHNTKTFKSKLSDQCLLMAVVKADGYGHGALEIAKTAIKAGADYLGVAFLDEAIQLRNGGIDSPILILGYTPFHSIEAAVKHHITITVFTDDVLDEIIACTERLGQLARIHLKVDTGMARLGISTKEEALSLCRKAMSSRFVILEGLFTHFANADNIDSSFTRMQFQMFSSLIEFLDEKQIPIPIKHCCNSAATMNFSEMHLDMARIGISLYGLLPSGENRHHAYPLQQAMDFKSKISSLKSVPKNHTISYGCTFRTEKDSMIATIPVGYADGISRLLSNRGFFLVMGQRVPIIGRVCMDQTMLDVTSVSHVQIGDEVTLFGKYEKSFLSIDELASLMNTINYEIVCSVGKRVPRVYIQNGGIVQIKNHILKESNSTAVLASQL